MIIKIEQVHGKFFEVLHDHLLKFFCFFSTKSLSSFELSHSSSSRVPETMPLYDILNEFQKGHSHMAVVVRQHSNVEKQAIENPVDSKL